MALFLVLQFTLVLNAGAHAPTLDSLLRNGENPDIGPNTVLATLRIKSEGKNDNDETIVYNQALKYLIYNENENSPRLIQLEFAANSLEDDNLFQFKSFPFRNLNGITRNTEKIRQRLFYSVMALLLRNDGSLIMDLLKSEGFPVKTNKELINTSKLRLLNKYKTYLTQQKEGIETIQNPLSPESPEEREEVQKIYNSPFIMEDGLVKLNKNGDHFNWVVDTNKLYIGFDHNHRIEELSFETKDGKYSVVFGRFLLQGAGMEFPEEVTFKTPNNVNYNLKMVSLKKWKDNDRAQSKRMDRYIETIKKNNITAGSEVPLLTL